MYYIYLLYSENTDLFYIGHTNDYKRRLTEHNESEYHTFTSKHRPWKLKAVFECGETRAEAMMLEEFIKKQKSRKWLQLFCQPDFFPSGKLAQLVNVPDVRD